MKAISARIEEDNLSYLKDIHQNVNRLINDLLRKWVYEHQQKQLLIFKEDTGQTDFAKMNNDSIFCSQSCSNCHNRTKDEWCKKIPLYDSPGKNFSCIYWKKKEKGGK